MAIQHGAATRFLWRRLPGLVISLILSVPLLIPTSIIAIEVDLDLEKYSDNAQKAASSKESSFLAVPRIKKEEMSRVYQRMRDQLRAKMDYWQLILMDDQHLRLLEELWGR